MWLLFHWGAFVVKLLPFDCVFRRLKNEKAGSNPLSRKHKACPPLADLPAVNLAGYEDTKEEGNEALFRQRSAVSFGETEGRLLEAAALYP